MNSRALVITDPSAELLPASVLKAVAKSSGESILLLTAAPERRDAMRLAWFAQTDASSASVRFATFAEIGEALLAGIFKGTTVALRGLQRYLLNAAIYELMEEGVLQEFAGAGRSRGFAEVAGRTFDEWDGDGGDNECLLAIRRIRDRYRQKMAAHDIGDPRVHDWEPVDDSEYGTIIVDDSANSARRWRKLIGALAEGRTTIVRQYAEGKFWFPEAEVQSVRPKKAARPKALEHLAAQLFAEEPVQKKSAKGLEFIEAPGELGEARMVARRIRELLADGEVEARRIVITAPNLLRIEGLLVQTLAEYGIPCNDKIAKPYTRQPAIRSLLTFLRIPERGWQFGDLSALLRSNYFQPAWPEIGGDVNRRRRAEEFLRYLGEPAGRQAFERGLYIWAEAPPPLLEDEDMEQRERRRIQRIAKEVGPFLHGLFTRLDSLPEFGTLDQHRKALRAFAVDMGIEIALEGHGDELFHWKNFSSILDSLPSEEPISRKAFVQTLLFAGREDADPAVARRGGVRVMPAESAAGIDCDFLFVIGLGEGEFPRLNGPNTLLSDADRKVLFDSGVPIANPENRLEDERGLFRRLIATPTRGLILSRPAVDAKGQPISPSTFLRAVPECFAPGAIKIHRKSMAIEGAFTEVAYSKAERRTRYAREVSAEPSATDWSWGGDCSQTLRRAALLAEARFQQKTHNSCDGMIETAPVVAKLQQKFGPEKIFSPTALEVYLSCPFRFLMQHVLNLKDLEEPSEEVSSWRRGMAFHRALTRLHETLRKEADVEPRSPEFRRRFESHLNAAIEEYAAKSPSPFTRKLWELEGKRLLRLTAGHGDQWGQFQDDWKPTVGAPRPAILERAFGFAEGIGEAATPAQPPLRIERKGEVIQLGGRIDRVDTVETPEEVRFWIIDYKTGGPSKYPAKMFETMEKLQLTLYALAAQRLFFGDKPARPLGLAYWFVAHSKGLTTVHPKTRKGKGPSSPAAPEDWNSYSARLEDWVVEIVGHVRKGHFPLAPRREESCAGCPYRAACRIGQSRDMKAGWKLDAPGGETKSEPEA